MNTNKPFDPTKPVMTRDGRKVRILATDLPGQCPIAAHITHQSGRYQLAWFSSEGKHPTQLGSASSLDLINIPEKRKLTGWVNVYNDGSYYIHEKRSQAESLGLKGVVACLDLSKYNIEFEEGEGL